MKKVLMSKCRVHEARLPSVLLEMQIGSGEHAFQSPTIESFGVRSHSFEKLLLEVVDEVFSSLGDSAERAIYLSLAKTFHIKKQAIPRRINEFANAIEEIFGLGGKLIEIQIMKRLYEKVGQSFEYFPEQDALVFAEYVEAVKSSLPCVR
jgi:hypothetical protein